MSLTVPPQARPAITIWRRLLALAAFGLALGPLGVGAAALSGHGHRWIDLLAQFTAPALAAALAGLGAFALLRLRAAALTSALAAALLSIAVWPQAFPDRGVAQAGAPQVTLYSANLWARNADIAAIRRSIVEADADIVILIELGDAPAGRLDEVLAGYPHRVLTPRVDRASGAARSAIASRYPLEEIADQPDGLHSVAAQAETPLGPLTVVGVHLTRPWPFQYQWGQITQAEALAAIVADADSPVVVAGDFNSLSSARIGRQVQRQTGLVPAPGWPGSWPSALPSVLGVTIDQVYRSRDLALLDRRFGRQTGSDHRPVVTRFTRAASAPPAG